MKKKLFLLLLWMLIMAGFLGAQSDPQAFEKAKLLIFDKQWAAALKQLDGVIAVRPVGRYYGPALFYRAKCQEELGAGKTALASYEKFLQVQPDSALAEDALISVIDLAAGLFQEGDNAYLPKVLSLLNHENSVVSYYAAFKLSYLPDSKTATRALPVLRAILENEKDEELRDRAKIAVMRIDPSQLNKMAGPQRRAAGKTLQIRIADRAGKKEMVSLSIPLALADLALRSLSAEQKRALQKEGHDLDGILDQLTVKGMKVDIRDGESVIQIWVD